MKQYNEPDENQFEEWRQNPENWKLGIFYFNPKDKRLFPPKRSKWNGRTINFANPFSVLVLVTILLLLNLAFSFAWFLSF